MFAPSQPAAPAQAAQPGAPAITICIAALADGTFMVYPEAEGGAEADPAGGAAEESNEMAGGQPAQDVDGALQLAKQMLAGPAAGGQPSAPAGGEDADALFNQGFNKARGTPLNRA